MEIIIVSFHLLGTKSSGPLLFSTSGPRCIYSPETRDLSVTDLKRFRVLCMTGYQNQKSESENL